MSETPDTIYLLHGNWEGFDGYVWSEDPAPSYADNPDDAIEYRKVGSESPASPAGSIADNLEAAFGAYPMQKKKCMQLIESGALICGLVVELNVPHRGRCTIDQHGRVVWSN